MTPLLETEHLTELQNSGYTVLPEFFSEKDLAPIREEMQVLGNYIFGSFSLDDPWGEKDEKKRSRFYRVTRYLSSLSRLAADEKNLQLCREAGMRLPCVMKSFNIRVDTPENKNLFHWHQDATYLLGSLSGLTFWIPMGKVDLQRGTIEVIPGSHREGFFPFECTIAHPSAKASLSPQDIRLEKDPVTTPVALEVNAGDLVVFSQFLLHRSTPNFSDRVRWTIQLRYADLLEDSFRDADYPLGDATNIFATPYMKLISKSEP